MGGEKPISFLTFNILPSAILKMANPLKHAKRCSTHRESASKQFFSRCSFTNNLKTLYSRTLQNATIHIKFFKQRSKTCLYENITYLQKQRKQSHHVCWNYAASPWLHLLFSYSWYLYQINCWRGDQQPSCKRMIYWQDTPTNLDCKSNSSIQDAE